jgi:predicted RNA binding protein YcfA (HicA-like mRNA interferase family)
MINDNGIKRGMGQRDAIRKLESLGFSISRRRGTGELFARHPTCPKPIIFKANRKDIPSEVVHLTNRILFSITR